MSPFTSFGVEMRSVPVSRWYDRAVIPGSTILVVCGAWVVLAVLTVIAYRFNRGRGGD